MTAIRKVLFFILFFITIYPLVFADTIHLKDGNKIEGIIFIETTDKVIVQVNIGHLTFNRAQIDSIEKSSDEENQVLKEKWQRGKEEQERLSKELKPLQVKQEEPPKPAKEKAPELKAKPKEPPKPKTVSKDISRFKSKLGQAIKFELSSDKSQVYFVYLPKDYSKDKKWPLFIGVHGLTANGMQAISDWMPYIDEEGYILVCPTFPDGYQKLEYNTDNKMLEIIKEVRFKYRIDEKKIFMSGFSAGGMFVSRFVFRHPDVVSGASIMSARWFDPLGLKSRTKTKFLVTIGENDTERINDSAAFAKSLQGYGYDVEFKTFPGVGHWMCEEARQETLRLYREIVGKI